MESNQIESNQIESNRFKSNRIESNRIKSVQIDCTRISHSKMTPQCVKQNVLTKHTNAKTGLLFCAFSQWCIGGTAKRLGLLLVVVLGARHSSSISTTQVVSRGCPTIYPPLSFSIYFSISISLSLSLSFSLSLVLYLSISPSLSLSLSPKFET
jgi:hypothetical protein